MGPAGMVSFDFQIPNLGRIMMFQVRESHCRLASSHRQTHLPLSAVTQHVTFSWYADSCIPSFLVSYVVGNWVAQWANDLSVWVCVQPRCVQFSYVAFQENKVYLPRPLLVKGDGPVSKLRRWFVRLLLDSLELIVSAGTRSSTPPATRSVRRRRAPPRKCAPETARTTQPPAGNRFLQPMCFRLSCSYFITGYSHGRLPSYT